MVSLGGYHRRSMKGKIPTSRRRIENIFQKVDEKQYVEWMKLRNKALIALLYLSARRISEIVGRKYKIKRGELLDEWRGVTVKDFHFDHLEGRDVTIMACRILKKGTRKSGVFRVDNREVVMLKDDPLMLNYILPWIKYVREHEGENAKLFRLNRHRAYQIIKELDPDIVGCHWFRHQRLSHLAEMLNPYQLTERIGFWQRLDPAISYVHGRMSTFFDAMEKVDKNQEEQ